MKKIDSDSPTNSESCSCLCRLFSYFFFFSVLRTFLQYFPPLNIFSFLINIFCAEFFSFSQIPRRLSSISRGVKFPRDSNGRRLLSLQCGKKWKIKKLNIVFRWVGSRSHGDGYHCRPRRIVNYCEDFHSILITISRFLLRIVIVFHPQLLHLSGSSIVPTRLLLQSLTWSNFLSLAHLIILPWRPHFLKAQHDTENLSWQHKKERERKEGEKPRKLWTYNNNEISFSLKCIQPHPSRKNPIFLSFFFYYFARRRIFTLGKISIQRSCQEKKIKNQHRRLLLLLLLPCTASEIPLFFIDPRLI